MPCLLPAAVLLQELDASSKAAGGAAAAVVSLQVLEAVVSEFSLVTASALGLSWEFHETCRNQLEVGLPGGVQPHHSSNRLGHLAVFVRQ